MSTERRLHNRFNKDASTELPIVVRNFNRRKLALLFAKLGFRSGAEVGVAAGDYSLILCQSIPKLKLMCVDPWMKYGENIRSHSQERQNENYRLAMEKLAAYDVRFVQAFSMDAARCVGDNTLDFVYIDGNHAFDYAIEDIIEWSKKVKPGGIVSGHDYYNFRYAGVVQAVNAYTQAHKIKEWFVDDRGAPSFFWVKQ